MDIINIIKQYKKLIQIYIIMDTKKSMDSSTTEYNSLFGKWVLWAHLPHDTDWALRSYKRIMKIEHVEEMIKLIKALPEKLIKNCMLFLMRDGINPMWEDPKNKDGGCFSFKVANKNVAKVWEKLSYAIVGESITKNEEMLVLVNGITISPKKSFCIIKIWLSSCSVQNPKNIIEIENLDIHGCLFKKHRPNHK